MLRAREGRRGGSRTEKGKGEAGKIGMIRWRQVTPRWSDDPVRIQDGCQWRGCWGSREIPPRKGVGRQEDSMEWVKNKYVTISNVS